MQKKDQAMEEFIYVGGDIFDGSISLENVKTQEKINGKILFGDFVTFVRSGIVGTYDLYIVHAMIPQ